MRKNLILFLFMISIISCSDTEINNSINNLSLEDHIELIKNHEDKLEITFEELPEVSQNYINTLENNITTELIFHAEDLGYEVKIKRESRSLISLLSMIYIYFDQNGELLFDDQYDGDYDGDYDVFEEWENIMCFDIEFPISVNMADDSQISIGNEDELFEAYYEASDEFDSQPEINFPINIIFYYENENGNELPEVIEVGSYEELEMYFGMCPDNDENESEDGDYENYWYQIDCFDLVYPISMTNPDGEILSVDSEYVLNEYVEQWYIDNECNNDECGGFEIVFPLTVEYYSETNDQTQNITIYSEEELSDYIDEYCVDDDDNDDEIDTCGEIVYPVTIEAPNGDQFTGNSEDEILSLMEEWYSNNCNSMECDDEFELVFPITMEFEDNQGDIIIITVQSEVMLEEITGQYCEN